MELNPFIHSYTHPLFPTVIVLHFTSFLIALQRAWKKKKIDVTNSEECFNYCQTGAQTKKYVYVCDKQQVDDAVVTAIHLIVNISWVESNY